MPLKSERQRKWMYANKPEMAKKWENKYKKGGKVDYKNYYGGGKVKYKRYKGGGKNTDTVAAMLTPGEVVLNEDQISSLEQYVGKKRAKIFADIGVPGFRRGGKAEEEADRIVKEQAKAYREDKAAEFYGKTGVLKVLYPKKLKDIAKRLQPSKKQKERKEIMTRYSKKKDFDVRDIVKDVELAEWERRHKKK